MAEALPPFEELDHTADRAYRARGRDLAELLVNAMRAMFALQGVESGGEANVTREVHVEGVDREALLVNWLSELLYLQETHGEVYGDAEFPELSQTVLRARVRGRRQPEARRVIKAVTFHDLEVKRDADGWQAVIVFDV